MVEVQDWALSSDEWAEGLTVASGPAALRIGFLRGPLACFAFANVN